MASDMMGGFGAEQFTKMLEGFRMPGLDVKALMDSQRKNVEALNQATQIVTQGATEVSQKQAEILRSTVEQAMAVATSIKAGDPAATAQAQQEFVKQAFETAVANARELAEMVGKSNREAYQTIERRMQEGMEQLRTMAQGKAPGS